MSSITIIEASRKNGIGTNSSWVNTYQQPMTIGTGDVVQLKQCFVDTNANNSGNITIDNDVDIELEMGYYMVNSKHPENVPPVKNGRQTGVDPEESTDMPMDYETYICRYGNENAPHWNEYQQILNKFNYTLKAGTYTPSALAELLTRAFTTVPFIVDIPNSSDLPFLN